MAESYSKHKSKYFNQYFFIVIKTIRNYFHPEFGCSLSRIDSSFIPENHIEYLFCKNTDKIIR